VPLLAYVASRSGCSTGNIMNFIVVQAVSRLTDKWRQLRCLTPQERADRYVAHLPIAVLGR
jgi:hypothetical protein